MNSIRKIKKITRGSHAVDGAGVHLVRVVGYRDVLDYDPFLLLDAFDSKNPEDYIKGFPWHPHRGIETVTYLIEGDIEHGDSLGNKGSILSGDCQWMTAGSGIIHQEMPQPTKRILAAQLWINLAAKDKMCSPKYGDIKSKDVPIIEEENAKIHIIAGNYKGKIEKFQIETIDKSIRFLLFSATPLKEPIAWGGPIVMNTKAELNQAFKDLDEGTFIKN